jgi:hypothetical protein
MRIVVRYAGEVYEMGEDSEASAADVSARLYEDLEHARMLRFALKDGGYLLLGEDALKRCAIMVLDS